MQFNAANAIGGSGANVTVNSPGIAAAGYAMDQTFLNRIVTTSTGAVALAANSSNALSLSGFANLELGGVGSVSYTGTLTPNGTTYRLGGGTGTITLSQRQRPHRRSRCADLRRRNRLADQRQQLHRRHHDQLRRRALAKSITDDATLTINSGTVQITAKAQSLDPTGTSIVSSISITSGKLDLANNAAIVDWSTNSPIGSIKQQIQSGAITSSVLDANHSIGFGEASSLGVGSFGGTNVDTSAVLLRATVNGDANLDGVVNVLDFTWLAANFNQSAH